MTYSDDEAEELYENEIEASIAHCRRKQQPDRRRKSLPRKRRKIIGHRYHKHNGRKYNDRGNNEEDTRIVELSSEECIGENNGESDDDNDVTVPIPIPQAKTYEAGTRTKKYFPKYDGWFEGTIVSYSKQESLYKVEYDDGDREELRDDEINVDGFSTEPAYELGKRFDRWLRSSSKLKLDEAVAARRWTGTIRWRCFDTDRKSWRYFVTYSDNEAEELYENEIEASIACCRQKQQQDRRRNPRPRKRKIVHGDTHNGRKPRKRKSGHRYLRHRRYRK